MSMITLIFSGVVFFGEYAPENYNALTKLCLKVITKITKSVHIYT